nr:hypothetical protein [Streptomyces antimycoticus]
MAPRRYRPCRRRLRSRTGRSRTARCPGRAGHRQTLLALVTAFTDPLRADDELALAHQYLAQLDQRATTFYAAVVALLRDAGTDRDVIDRAAVLHTESTVAGLPWLTPLIHTAVAFHHAVRDAPDDLTATIDHLRETTATGDFAYYVGIATAMGGLPQPAGSAIQWLDDTHSPRTLARPRHHPPRPPARHLSCAKGRRIGSGGGVLSASASLIIR